MIKKNSVSHHNDGCFNFTWLLIFKYTSMISQNSKDSKNSSSSKGNDKKSEGKKSASKSADKSSNSSGSKDRS